MEQYRLKNGTFSTSMRLTYLFIKDNASSFSLPLSEVFATFCTANFLKKKTEKKLSSYVLGELNWMQSHHNALIELQSANALFIQQQKFAIKSNKFQNLPVSHKSPFVLIQCIRQKQFTNFLFSMCVDDKLVFSNIVDLLESVISINHNECVCVCVCGVCVLYHMNDSCLFYRVVVVFRSRYRLIYIYI